jgi:hypothetical protein
MYPGYLRVLNPNQKKLKKMGKRAILLLLIALSLWYGTRPTSR